MDAYPIAALVRNRVSNCHEEVGHTLNKHVRLKCPPAVLGDVLFTLPCRCSSPRPLRRRARPFLFHFRPFLGHPPPNPPVFPPRVSASLSDRPSPSTPSLPGR